VFHLRRKRVTKKCRKQEIPTKFYSQNQMRDHRGILGGKYYFLITTFFEFVFSYSYLVDRVRGACLFEQETRDNSNAFNSVLRTLCDCDITCLV
jgi:hypothetical protein